MIYTNIINKIIKRGLLVSIFLILGCSSGGCSSDGIEGNVEFWALNKPLINVTVEAHVNSDIPQIDHQRFIKTVKTDRTGHFKFSNLNSNINYVIIIKDPYLQIEPGYRPALRKGIIKIKRPLQVIPIPQSGIWIFNGNINNMIKIDVPKNRQVVISVFNGISPSTFGPKSVFSVSDEDVINTATLVPKDSLLILRNINVIDMASLFKIEQKTVSLGSNGESTIPTGWYYNVRDFISQSLLSSENLQLKPVIDRPELGDLYKSKEHDLVAIPIKNIRPGTYILVTKVLTNQNDDKILGGENQPQLGYIIKIGN